MFAEFADYISFAAAAYVTMTLNNEICRSFWTPSHAAALKQALASFKFEGSSKLFNGLLDAVERHHLYIENLSNKKGGYMLAICVLTLMFIGFEVEVDSAISVAFGFYVGAFLSLIVLLFSQIFLKKWKRVTISILLVSAATIFAAMHSPRILPYVAHGSGLFVGRKFAIAVFFILPILYQLAINWLYSSVYFGYIKAKVGTEHQQYQQALGALRACKKIDMPDKYLDAWTEQNFPDGSTRTGDNSITAFTRVLIKSIEKQALPGKYGLLFSWIKFKFSKLFNSDNNHIVSEATPQNQPAETDYSEIYDKYVQAHKLDYKVNLKRYCRENNHDYKEMVEWCKINRPRR